MEIGRTLARITRRRHMHWTFVGLSHAGLPLAGGDAGAPADDQRGRKIEFLQKAANDGATPPAAEIQHSQPHSGSTPVFFEGVDILNREKGGKRRRSRTDTSQSGNSNL